MKIRFPIACAVATLCVVSGAVLPAPARGAEDASVNRQTGPAESGGSARTDTAAGGAVAGSGVIPGHGTVGGLELVEHTRDLVRQVK